VGGHHQGIDVAARDGQPEVVTNERIAQARVLVVKGALTRTWPVSCTFP
jgi:hypothetical protein